MVFALFCFCVSKELEGLVVWEKYQLRPGVLLGQVVPTTEVARIGHDDFELLRGYPSWGERQGVLCLSVKCRGNH